MELPHPDAIRLLIPDARAAQGCFLLLLAWEYLIGLCVIQDAGQARPLV